MTLQYNIIREFVEARADGRCEYCRRYQEFIGEIFFEVEHIIPRSMDGSTHPDNLAFACRRCNLLKGSVIYGFDQRTQQQVRLFNPRVQKWHQHFRRSADKLRIYGRTKHGRVTIARLQMNTASEQRARKAQRDHLAEIFPLD